MKMFKIIAFTLITGAINAQSLYMDPATVTVITVNGQILKNQQENHEEKLSTLNQLQATTNVVMQKINTTQEKIHQGLTEVNSIVSNSLALQRTYENLNDAISITNESIETIADNPHYTLLMTDIMQRYQESTIEIYSEIANVITGSAQNLMTSGDRKQLLYEIENASYQLKLSAIMVRIRMRRIERVGFLKSINPFNNTMNSDLDDFVSIINL